MTLLVVSSAFSSIRVMYPVCSAGESVVYLLYIVLLPTSSYYWQAGTIVSLTRPVFLSIRIGDVSKIDIRFGFGFLKPNRPKIWHLCRQFSHRNCVQFAIQIKSE